MNMEKISEENIQTLIYFLSPRKVTDWPVEKVLEWLKVVINKGTSDEIQVCLTQLDCWPEDFKSKALEKIANEILEKSIITKEERETLHRFFQKFPENLMEKVIQKFLDLEDHIGLLGMLHLSEETYGPRTIKWREKAKKKIIDGKDPYPVYYLLSKFSFAEEEKRDALAKIISSNDAGLIYLALLQIEGWSLDFQEKALNFLRSFEYRAPREEIIESKPTEMTSPVIDVIESIFGDKWILYSRALKRALWETYGKTYNYQNADFNKSIREDYEFHESSENYLYRHFWRTRDGIPVFRDVLWFLRDLEKKEIAGIKLVTGALLYFAPTIDRHVTREPLQVLLLLNLNGGSKGYAFLANPRARTVKEAIAYGCQIDPEKFKGFLVEK